MRRGRPGARCEIRKFGELPIAGQNSARVHKRWGAQGQRPIPCRPYCRKRKSKSLDGARHFENRRSALEHLVTIKRWEPPCAAPAGRVLERSSSPSHSNKPGPGRSSFARLVTCRRVAGGQCPFRRRFLLGRPPSREGPTPLWSPSSCQVHVASVRYRTDGACAGF
jgi:hypothetical protein